MKFSIFFFQVLFFYIANTSNSLNTTTVSKLHKSRYIKLYNTLSDDYHNGVDYGSISYNIKIQSKNLFNVFWLTPNEYKEYLQIYTEHKYSQCSFCKRTDHKINFNLTSIDYYFGMKSFDQIETQEDFFIIDNSGFPYFSGNLEDIEINITYEISSSSQEGSYVVTIICFISLI